MALTIQTGLPKGAEGRLYHTILKDVYSWFYGISILTGYKEQATIADFALENDVLSTADCVVDDNDITLNAKEVGVKNYNFSLPVPRCDLNKTWLAAFAEGYEEGKDVFIDKLIPFIASKVGYEVRATIVKNMLDEASADSDVSQVTTPPAATTPALAYAAIVAFVSGLPAAFKKEALDISWVEYDYVVNVSAAVLSDALVHSADKTSGAYMYVGGFRIEADPSLSGVEMYVTPKDNILAVFDDSADINTVRVVPRDWENKDYIVGGIAFGGSYVDARKIVITDNI